MAENATKALPVVAVEGPQETGSVGYKHPPLNRRFGVPGGNDPRMGGRPKGSSILAPILRMLAEGAKDDPNGEGTEAKLLARVAIIGAKNGEDISSILKLMERTDGAIKQSVEHSGGTSIRVHGVDPEVPQLPESF